MRERACPIAVRHQRAHQRACDGRAVRRGRGETSPEPHRSGVRAVGIRAPCEGLERRTEQLVHDRSRALDPRIQFQRLRREHPVQEGAGVVIDHRVRVASILCAPELDQVTLDDVRIEPEVQCARDCVASHVPPQGKERLIQRIPRVRQVALGPEEGQHVIPAHRGRAIVRCNHGEQDQPLSLCRCSPDGCIVLVQGEAAQSAEEKPGHVECLPEGTFYQRDGRCGHIRPRG